MTDRPRRGPSDGRARRNSGTPRFVARKKVCEFTRLGIEPDYKDISRLQKYVSQQGKIMPRRRTGCTAKMQRLLTTAIKRARHMSLLPYVASHAIDRRPLGGGRDRDRDRDR